MVRSESYLREEESVLYEKFFHATNFFGFSSADVSRMLGVSEATISRAKKSGSYFVRGKRHQWEVAELFIRIHSAVKVLFSNPRKRKHWLLTYSHELAAIPFTLIFTFEGLLEVVEFAEKCVRESKLSKFERRLANQER